MPAAASHQPTPWPTTPSKPADVETRRPPVVPVAVGAVVVVTVGGVVALVAVELVGPGGAVDVRGAATVGETTGPVVPVVGGDAGGGVMSNEYTTALCPGSAVQEKSTSPAAGGLPLASRGVKCRVKSWSTVIVAWPDRWNTSPGVVPVAWTVSGPDAGTAACGAAPSGCASARRVRGCSCR